MTITERPEAKATSPTDEVKRTVVRHTDETPGGPRGIVLVGPPPA